MLALFRAHWRVMLAAGLVIFAPVGLLETLDTSLKDATGDADDLLSVIEVIGIGLLDVAGALLGQILFAGVISALATTGRTPGGLGQLLRELPVGRLILADIAFVLVVVAGFALLIVPGFVFLVWFSLIGPVIEVERIGVVAAFRRSRQIVRTRTGLVAAFVLPLAFAEAALDQAIRSASIWSLGDNFFGDWTAGALATLVTSGLAALAVSVLYLELSGRGASLRTPPAGSRRPRRELPA